MSNASQRGQFYDLIYNPNRPDQKNLDYFQNRPRTADSGRGNGHSQSLK